MEKIIIWYESMIGGDGAAYANWSLTEPVWREGQGETGTVETFEGSNVHRQAVFNAEDD